MTHRQTRGRVLEDAFGAPPQSRGSMMNVAGKTDDELEPGEELLTDEGDDCPELAGDGMATMRGPVYPEGVARISMGQLRSFVRRALVG